MKSRMITAIVVTMLTVTGAQADYRIDTAAQACSDMLAFVVEDLAQDDSALLMRGMCLYSRYMALVPAESPARLDCSKVVSAYVRELTRRGINPVGLC